MSTDLQPDQDAAPSKGAMNEANSGAEFHFAPTDNAVDPTTLKVWRIHAGIVVLVLLMPISGVGVALGGLLGSLLVMTCLLLFACAAWFFPAAYYKRLRFGVDQMGLTIARGVVWRSQVAVPRSRIQHSDITQGPLQRRYEIATLKLYTAGSRYTKTELPGLKHTLAVRLRDILLNREDGGV